MKTSLPSSFTVLALILAWAHDATALNIPGDFLGGKAPYIPPLRPPPTPQCPLIGVQVIARHGTREPTKSDVRNLDRLALLSQHIPVNASDPETSLHGWQSPYHTMNDGKLNHVGEKDMQQLALRDLHRYGITSAQLLPDSVRVYVTSVPRTHDSSINYLSTFLGNPDLLRGLPANSTTPVKRFKVDDARLHSWKQCSKWNLNQFENKQSDRLTWQIAKNRIYMHLAPKLHQRLGLAQDIVFPSSLVDAVYTACQFGYSTRHDLRWCSLFTVDELVQLEWIEDVDQWRSHGPGGGNVNDQVMCEWFAKIVENIKKAISRDILREHRGDPVVIGRWDFAFAHAETLVPLLGLLGHWRDAPHLIDVTKVKEAWEGFVHSRDVPFGANVHLEIYRPCATLSKSALLSRLVRRGPDNTSLENSVIDDDIHSKWTGYRIRMLLNERVISLGDASAGCDHDGLCDVEKWIAKYEQRGCKSMKDWCGDASPIA